MVVFLDCSVVVEERPVAHRVNVEGVGHSIVPHIVADGRDYQRDQVQRIKLANLQQAVVKHNEIHLHYVDSVQVVVVLYWQVVLLDFNKELMQ